MPARSYKPLIVFALIALASAAYAHTGVKNPAVMARMESMKAIGDDMKILGEMAKGKVAFDQATARAAAAGIAKHAAETPTLFEAEEDDPKSEAKQEIWSNFDDFTKKSEALVQVAQDLSESLTTEDDLRIAMKSLGDACQACHKPYRE